ncbi:hypothetical protein BH23ACT11_BH23ACT11_29450 [soil metagenome]
MARRHRVSLKLSRLVPFGLFSGFGTLAAVSGEPGGYLVAAFLGLGAVYSGKRVLNRKENKRRELSRRARSNVAELGRVARTDRVAASQMKRLAALQDGVLEGWDLLPEEYGPLLEEDIFTILGEVEDSVRLARRRAALRRHLENVDRRGIRRRIKDLEKDLAALGPDAELRSPFESALASRREELTGYDDILSGISVINAQLEGVESLLGNLRGELLSIDTSLSPRSVEPGLVQLKDRISYFRRSLDEVTRTVDHLPTIVTEELPTK